VAVVVLTPVHTVSVVLAVAVVADRLVAMVSAAPLTPDQAAAVWATLHQAQLTQVRAGPVSSSSATQTPSPLLSALASQVPQRPMVPTK